MDGNGLRVQIGALSFMTRIKWRTFRSIVLGSIMDEAAFGIKCGAKWWAIAWDFITGEEIAKTNNEGGQFDAMFQ